MKKLGTFTILYLLLFSTSFAQETKHKELKLCFLEWGKLGGEKQINKGVYVDLVSRVFKDAGYKVTVDFLIWDDCVTRTEKLEFDVIPIVWEGDVFDNRFLYLKRVGYDSIHFVALKSSGIKNGFASSLVGKRVGWVKSSGGLEDFHKIKEHFKSILLKSNKEQVTSLLNKMVDSVVTDPVAFEGELNKLFPNTKIELDILDPALKINYSSPAISKKHPDRYQIIKDFENSYSKLIESGLYEDLYKTHGIKIKRNE